MRRSPETIRQYRRVATHYATHVDVVTIDTAGIQDYVVDHYGDLAPRSVRTHVVVLKALHTWLVDVAQVRDDNPAKAVRAPTFDDDLTPPPPADAILRVIASLDSETRAVATLLYGCGLRIHEGVAVTRDSIDLRALTVTVLGKGRKLRTIAMPAGAVPAIAAHLANVPADRDELFAVTTRHVAKRLRAAAVALGLDPAPWHPHMLRHACATHLTARDTQQELLRRQLRHANGETTRKYQRLVVDDLVAALRCHPMNDERTASTDPVRVPGASTVTGSVRLRGWAA